MKCKMNQMWDDVVEQFERVNPDLADRVVDWYPSGQAEITLKMDNGVKYIYNVFDTMPRIVFDPDKKYDGSEEEWRCEFSKRLNKRMRLMFMNQYTLSELTGISSVTISKYMNGKATPSGHNLDKIAAALRCSISELMNIR